MDNVNKRFTITLERLPHGPPAIVRVRMALKTLLRRHGLRAVRQETPRQTPPGTNYEPSDAQNAPASRRTPAKANSARDCTKLHGAHRRTTGAEED